MICHWHEGLPGLKKDLPSLAISWIAMEIMGLFPCFVLVGSHVSLAWVELLVRRRLGWTNTLEAL